MLTFRTTPPPSYLPPTQQEMEAVAAKIGLPKFSRDLAADLANRAAGGVVLPASAFRRQVEEEAEKTLPAPDANGNWALRSGKTGNRAAAVKDRAEQAMSYHRSVCQFLQSIDVSRFPGATPLEQAMSVLKLLAAKPGGAATGPSGEPMPIFEKNDFPEGVAQELEEVMDTLESLSEAEEAMVQPVETSGPGEGSDGNGGDGGDGESLNSKSDSSKPLSKLKVAEELADKQKKGLMLEISRVLKQFAKLQMRKMNKQVPDPAGEERRIRPIAHLGELPRVTSAAWAIAGIDENLFLVKAVRGDLDIREKVTRLEKKQAVFILFDGSGSMKQGSRHWRASGVVMHFLKAVIAGDAEVFLSVFDAKLSKVLHAGTPEEAREVIRVFTEENFTGGSTDIAGAVKAAHAHMEKLIAEGKLLYRPQIVVLTDEDESVDGVKAGEIKGTTVHGFAMEVANPKLVAFAESTGGVGKDMF